MSTATKFAPTPHQGEARSHQVAGSRSGSWTPPRIVRRSVSFLTTSLLVLAVAAFLMLAIGPRLLGYQTSTMLTGSMSPLINPGDVVVTRPVPVDEIRPGDIITYSIPVEDRRIETHRVTAVTMNPDGATAVQTKGDANNGVDPWVATINGTSIDRHVLTVPYVGNAIRAMREPILLNILMYGAPSVLVISLLASIWGKKPETDAPKEILAAEARA